MKSYEQTALAILLGRETKTEENVEEFLLEDTEQIDELKKSTLGSYVKKAQLDKSFYAADMGRMGSSGDTSSPSYNKVKRYHKNRGVGINRAVDRLTKEEIVRAGIRSKLAREEVEDQVDEMLYPKSYGGEDDDFPEKSKRSKTVTHPMAVHVKPVSGKKVQGLPAYQVSKVGSQVKRIKVGEHLNDTHLDDLADIGHKIRMKEDVDYTVISHNSFEVFLPESLTYNDYLNAAKLFEDSEVVKIADECFQEQDESIVVASESIETLREEIQSFIDEGHEVSLPKYTGETDNPGVEFIVTDRKSGTVTKYVHHGIVKRS
jgi:hypothetical protein